MNEYDQGKAKGQKLIFKSIWKHVQRRTCLNALRIRH